VSRLTATAIAGLKRRSRQPFAGPSQSRKIPEINEN
jgi:hypothetical protein